MTGTPARPLGRRLLRSGLLMLLLGIGVHLLLPQLAGLEATARAIATATWWLPVVLIGLEAASLAAYGRVLVVLLERSGEHVGEGYVQRTVLVGNSVGRALPGGSGTASAIVLSGFRSHGLDAARTLSAMWGAGLLSSAVLGLLLPVGVVIGVIGGDLGGIGLSAAVGAVGLVAAAALVPLALRDPDAFGRRVSDLVRATAVGPLRRHVDPAAVAEGVRRGTENLRELTADRVTLRSATGWALANWLLDVAVLVVLAMTVGRGTPLDAVLVAYVVAQVVAALPLTPGGVGVVETAMVGAFVAAGAPAAAATATVLGWRLISHWLPIPIGLALLPTVHRR